MNNEKSTRERIQLGELTQVSRSAAIKLVNHDLVDEYESEHATSDEIHIHGVKFRSFPFDTPHVSVEGSENYALIKKILEEFPIPRGEHVICSMTSSSRFEKEMEDEIRRFGRGERNEMDFLHDVFLGDPGDVDETEMKLFRMARKNARKDAEIQRAVNLMESSMSLMKTAIKIAKSIED